MKINNRYKIESDDVSITLYESYIGKEGKFKGEEQWKAIGWFSTFEGVMGKVIDLGVKKTELKDLGDIIDEIKYLKNMISEIDFSNCKGKRIYIE